QCLHQNTRRWNAPLQQLSLADQVIGGGARDRYGVIAISTPSPLTRQVDVDDGAIGQEISSAQELLADLPHNPLSTLTLRSRLAVPQPNAQRHPGDRQREIITGSFGNP